ncbi:MAG: PilC/PilY family type IV pilus protein, partial [Gammaproteobacteria bacterium]
AYYALDITDPDNPSFLWKITNSTSGFSELGYTFAQPRVATMRFDNGSSIVTKPVVVFAAGYDTNKDATSTGSDDSMGRGIFVVDAETGSLRGKAVNGGSTGNVSSTEYDHANLVDSIPSTLTLVDTNGDENADRAYVGDTGGRVWRFDMEGTDRTNWTATVLANVGRHYTNATGNDRRFFHRPDFIQFRDSTGDYDAVVIASGNRAHPLDTGEDDFIYMIKDRAITSGSPSGSTYSHTDFFDATSNCLQTSSGCSGSTSALDNGWKVELEANGEKSLATPTTLAKKIYVTSYLPPGSGSNGSCEPDEGTGRLYALNLADATAVNDYYVENGDSLEKQDRYTDLKSGGIPAEVVYVPFDKVLKPDLSIDNVNTSGRWKTYWFKSED